MYSKILCKTAVLKIAQKGFRDRLSLNACQNYSKILSTFIKGIYFSKALTCMKLLNKNAFYQGDGYTLATLLYEQFIHLT